MVKTKEERIASLQRAREDALEQMRATRRERSESIKWMFLVMALDDELAVELGTVERDEVKW